jgi:hypothetical protein
MPRFESLCSTVIRPDSEWKALLQTCVRKSHFASELRRRIQSCSSCIKRNRTLFGQGIVLADTKTARPSPRVFVPSSAGVGALNAFGLFARATRPSKYSRGEASLVRMRPAVQCSLYAATSAGICRIRPRRRPATRCMQSVGSIQSGRRILSVDRRWSPWAAQRLHETG